MGTEASVHTRRKLIEVALPLEAINAASAREKSIRHGHPSTLHLWWARRPLATARAVIFAQMVDDPSAHPDLYPTVEAQQEERQRLFEIIKELVLWENTTNEEVLERAREEIRRNWQLTCADNADHPRAKELFNPEKLPAFHDPFAGGGALPLEAQRLGLESHASDLNPVAVLINKAMIEIPPKFAGQPPVNPEARGKLGVVEQQWSGAQGLAEDVRYYGQWMRDEAEKRIGHLYPKVAVTAEMAKERPDLEQYVGQELTVIAWLWARTVKSPNPAFADMDVPLISNYMLSTKKGKEAYVEPVIEDGGYRFTVKVGRPKDMAEKRRGTKLGRGASFECLMSAAPIDPEYIYAEANAGRMGERLMAVVAEGTRGRVYLPALLEMEETARRAHVEWRPEVEMPDNPRWFSPPLYGLPTFGDLFTPRQLVALTTFSDLVQEAVEQAKRDALVAGLVDDGQGLDEGGCGATSYAEAVGVYLAFAVDKGADYWSTICSWLSSRETMGHTFCRQAIPMTWDYAEANAFSNSTGNWSAMIDWIWKVLAALLAEGLGRAMQVDAQTQIQSFNKVMSTDPPYYDNIGYADLSDFFYVWLRRSQKSTFPGLFAKMEVPKAEELIASPYRHGSREEAEAFFMEGMARALRQLAEQAHPAYPVTVYYAFKQSETEEASGTASTGWETFLEAVIEAGFGIGGTWPVRTERSVRSTGIGTNALASSIVLVCRPRSADAPVASRREFIAALRRELPKALDDLQRGNIAPVDLAQAAIGPGMAVYTRFSQVLEADGERLGVREALALINQTLDEVLAEQEGDVDAETRWALAWFEQYGFEEAEYGVAETLSKAKNTSVAGMVQAGFLYSVGGQVRLLLPKELVADQDPASKGRMTVWEAVHRLVHVVGTEGETAAARLLRDLGSVAEDVRELAYRLYTISERKRWAEEAFWYNSLVQSWREIVRLSRSLPDQERVQTKLSDAREG